MKREIILLMIVVSISGMAFCFGMFTGFSKIDDSWMLLANPYIKEISLENIRTIFTTSYHGQYSPVNTVYYSLLIAIHGINPVAFHLYSILIHCINVVLVYFLVRELISKYDSLKDDDAMLGVLIALIFGIHPMQVESVVWISASKILLYSSFFLSALLFYVKISQDKKKCLLSTYTFYLSFKFSFERASCGVSGCGVFDQLIIS